MEAFRKIGKWVSVMLLSLMLHNVVFADTVSYFHNDISGSPMAATNSAGNLLWKENYKPYGDKLTRSPGSSDNKIGFHGKPHDDGTGLSYMRARYYDPVLGRFMGVDPVDFQASNVHSFNRYTYANNNPYKYIDPDGRYAFLIAPAVYLLTALSTAVAVKMAMTNNSNSASGDFGAGGAIYSGTDIGSPSQWSSRGGYSGSSTSSEEYGSRKPLYAVPPADAKDPNGAKAPGKPGAAEGFKDPKSGESWVPNPNPGKGGGKHGWLDAKGNVWVPSGQGGRAHGGPHWDVQKPGGGYENIRPVRD
ncbi:MAG: RHS domain-containing protein [Pseudomonas putida]|jgi:RHS repeat-associated protein|nr:RHS domain-containing protein [Pseudomonas putida]